MIHCLILAYCSGFYFCSIDQSSAITMSVIRLFTYIVTLNQITSNTISILTYTNNMCLFYLKQSSQVGLLTSKFTNGKSTILHKPLEEVVVTATGSAMTFPVSARGFSILISENHTCA